MIMILGCAPYEFHLPTPLAIYKFAGLEDFCFTTLNSLDPKLLSCISLWLSYLVN